MLPVVAFSPNFALKSYTIYIETFIMACFKYHLVCLSSKPLLRELVLTTQSEPPALSHDLVLLSSQHLLLYYVSFYVTCFLAYCLDHASYDVSFPRAQVLPRPSNSAYGCSTGFCHATAHFTGHSEVLRRGRTCPRLLMSLWRYQNQNSGFLAQVSIRSSFKMSQAELAPGHQASARSETGCKVHFLRCSVPAALQVAPAVLIQLKGKEKVGKGKLQGDTLMRSGIFDSPKLSLYRLLISCEGEKICGNQEVEKSTP